MEILKILNLGIAFLLELAMLVIYGFFGYRLLPAEISWDTQNWIWQFYCRSLWRLSGDSCWHRRAVNRLKMPGLLIAKIIIFGAGAVMLWGLGKTSLAIIAAVVIAVHLILSVVWKQT